MRPGFITLGLSEPGRMLFYECADCEKLAFIPAPPDPLRHSEWESNLEPGDCPGRRRTHRVLLIYCAAGLYCHHSAVVDAERRQDETVVLDLDAKAVCTKCGMIDATARPNWNERPP